MSDIALTPANNNKQESRRRDFFNQVNDVPKLSARAEGFCRIPTALDSFRISAHSLPARPT
jgi:hypothetical protein